MRTPFTLYFYRLPFSKILVDLVQLNGLRVCLFFLTTSFRYCGSSLAIALLLFLMGTSGEPVNLSDPRSNIIFLLPRILSILLGLMWMSLALCRLLVQWTQAGTWRQEMQRNEECLRCRISRLEDWLVLPTYQIQGETIQVRYQQPERSRRQ